MKKSSSTQPTSVKAAETKTIKGGMWKKFLGTGALLLTLASPGKLSAQEQKFPKTKNDTIEMVKKEQKIAIHGSIRAGSNVTPLLGSVLSNTPAVRLTIDASNPKSGLGVSIIRFDDFNKSIENPASQLTMVDLYWQKKFGKLSITGVGEYVNIDKIPGSHSFTPIVGLTYDAGKGWTFDAWACYTFQKGEDEAAFRVGITKKLNECTSLALQAIYNGGKLSGRVQADVNLGNGFGAQLSFVASNNGKIIPTLGCIYKF